MISSISVDYSAGGLPGVPNNIKKALKKAKIKLSKKASIVFQYDEKGQPAYYVVLDEDKAYLIVNDSVYPLEKVETIPSDTVMLIATDEYIDIVVLEADADYYRLTSKEDPNLIVAGIIHEELGLKHSLMPLVLMYDLKGEEKDAFTKKVIEAIKEEVGEVLFTEKDIERAFVYKGYLIGEEESEEKEATEEFDAFEQEIIE